MNVISRSLRCIALALILAVLQVFGAVPAAAQTSGNWYGTLLPSAARTAATVTSADVLNVGWRGVHVIIKVTSWTSGTYTPVIQGKSPLGDYYTLVQGSSAAGTQINTTLCSAGCVIVLKVYPTATQITNAVASDVVPYLWRVQLAGASTPSATFSVSFNAVQ